MNLFERVYKRVYKEIYISEIIDVNIQFKIYLIKKKLEQIIIIF